MFAGNFAPVGWALCNGQLLSIAQNTALFSILGTFYGGNGTTNFALPNLQSRVAIHSGEGTGLSPYTIGQIGGAENVTLTVSEIPAHNHTVNCDAQGTGHSSAGFGKSSGGTPANSFPGLVASAADGVYSNTSNASMNANMVSGSGGSQPHSNIQPYLCVTFIIALQGIFPSRN